uniref:Uncharacterized protein n=1 Tax=Rhizophora mucronata TaxID=61149 RepID=A0A2P2QM12_RHIMU
MYFRTSNLQQKTPLICILPDETEVLHSTGTTTVEKENPRNP